MGSAQTLDGVLEQQPHALPDLGLRPPPGDGWLLAGDLLDDQAALDAWVSCVERGVRGLLQDRAAPLPRHVATSYAVGWYLYAVAQAAAVPFRARRRVPVLAPGELALRMAPDGWFPEVRPLSRRFACLPGDPAATDPHAQVVPDLEALDAVLRARFAAHAEAFFASWGPRGRRGLHLRRAFTTDALVDALWEGDGPADRAGAAEALRVLTAAVEAEGPGGREAFAGPVRFGEVLRPDGRPCQVRQRLACCFAYRLPATQACFSCPRVDDEEREHRLATDPALAAEADPVDGA